VALLEQNLNHPSLHAKHSRKNKYYQVVVSIS